eukprot:GHVR01107729.1.p1 GENE.GHVR01107729.1~~GHVR01107729.1.p1  ORF type:complete len:316 (+),score=37.51 GHVR01107729.1:63-1010(+)
MDEIKSGIKKKSLEESKGHEGDSTDFLDKEVYAKETYSGLLVCKKCLIMHAIHEWKVAELELELELNKLELRDLYEFVREEVKHEKKDGVEVHENDDEENLPPSEKNNIKHVYKKYKLADVLSQLAFKGKEEGSKAKKTAHGANIAQSSNPSRRPSSSVSLKDLKNNDLDLINLSAFLMGDAFKKLFPKEPVPSKHTHSPKKVNYPESKLQTFVDQFVHCLTDLLNKKLTMEKVLWTLEYTPNRKYSGVPLVSTEGSKPDCRWIFKKTDGEGSFKCCVSCSMSYVNYDTHMRFQVLWQSATWLSLRLQQIIFSRQ